MTTILTPCTYAVGLTRGEHVIAAAERRQVDRPEARYTIEWYQIACMKCSRARWERVTQTRLWLNGKERKCVGCMENRSPTGRFCPVCSSCPGRSCAKCGGVPERVVSTDAWDRNGEQHTVRL